MADKEIAVSSVITTTVFALTFLLIGIPLWWTTTEVYRYPIPHDECQQLLKEPVVHVIHAKLILSDRNVQQGVLWEKLLQVTKSVEGESSLHNVILQWSMSTVTDEEQHLIEQINSISELDTAFYLYEEAGKKGSVYLKPSGEIKVIVLKKNFTSGPKFWIGRGTNGYIINDSDSQNLAYDVVDLAKKIAQVERLKKLFIPASSYSGDQKPDKDRMRHLKLSTDFDITFSLIVPEPHMLDVSWNIENAVNAYINPMLQELSLLSKISVKSQILYMTSLPIPKKLPKNKNGEFTLNSEHLPSLINPIEARLGSDTSVHPNLNFVVYIPTGEQTPLRIHDPLGNIIHTNAFLLPQWGGFMIYNCPIPEKASLPYWVHLNERIFMEVFLSQFRLLLGLPEMNELNDAKYQVLPSSGLRRWELDFLLRKNTQEQISATASSLSSLSHLLHSISNIVIRDDVGLKIYTALLSAKESLKLLAEGYLTEGFSKARTAFVASEEAFFDPSLLALLYFPEDQKYAIYIPLFLPVSLPVLASLNRLWKFWNNRRSKLKKD